MAVSVQINKRNIFPLDGNEDTKVFLQPRPTASQLRPDYLADFLPEKIWRTFYNEVLPDFLTYYFPHSVQKNIFYRILI